MKKKLLSSTITRILFVIMLCLPAWNSMQAKDPEAYAVLDKETGTLTFKYDTERPKGAYKLNKEEDLPAWVVKDMYQMSNMNRIKKVVFEKSFAQARPESCHEWFYGCNELTTIEGIENLNTENATSMCNMFCNCSSLTSIDVSNFNTKNVTNMRSMFAYCSNLTTIDVSNFDTQNVEEMESMFSSCKNITKLDLSNFNTQNVMTMGWMFYRCTSLEELNISNFNTQNVEDMQSMFEECSGLNELNVSNFNTQNVTNMDWMFHNCKKLTDIDVSRFNTQNVTRMKAMFYNCINITKLNLANFDTKNVTHMGVMFYGCNELTTIYASDKFVTTKVDISDNMFTNCKKLVGAVPYDSEKIGHEMANYETGYFTDITKTGIEAASISDNAVATYYDVQGRRLDAPQKGINIMKRGGRTTKVLVK